MIESKYVVISKASAAFIFTFPHTSALVVTGLAPKFKRMNSQLGVGRQHLCFFQHYGRSNAPLWNLCCVSSSSFSACRRDFTYLFRSLALICFMGFSSWIIVGLQWKVCWKTSLPCVTQSVVVCTPPPHPHSWLMKSISWPPKVTRLFLHPFCTSVPNSLFMY